MWRSAVPVLLLAVAVTPAWAQPRPGQAEELFKQGRELMAAGKLDEACVALQQSHELEAKVTTLLNLAGCHEKAGRLATARQRFLEAEQQTSAARDEATVQLHRVAIERAFRLEVRVSKLMFRVDSAQASQGLELLRDGKPVPAEQWNRELPLDGGTFAIVARAPGAVEWTTTVTLAPEADRQTVEVPALEKPPPAEPVPAPPAKAPAAAPPTPAPAVMSTAATVRGERSRTAGQRSLALPLSLGVGAVALLGGAVGASLWASATYDDARAEKSDQARRDALEDSANRRRYAAEGLALAGLGCAGAAAWLYFRRPKETGAAHAQVLVTPTLAGLGVATTF